MFAATLMVFATLPAQALGATTVMLLSVSADDSGHALLSGGYSPDAGAMRFAFTSRSSDGGAMWTPTTHPNSGNFISAMAPSGAAAVRFVGADAWKSTDYGATWAPGGTVPYGPSIFAAALADASTGWAVGSSGTLWDDPNGQGTGAAIYRTTNGGSDWTREFHGPVQDPDAEGNPVSTYAELHGVDGYDANTAWAVGWQTNGGATLRSALAYKTIDGGDTWLQMTSGISSYRLYTVAVPSTSTAFIGGERNVVYKTVNGGSSWTVAKAPVAATTPQSIFWGSSFVSPTTGWFVGANSAGGGTIYKTTNGTTFVEQTSKPAGTPRLRAVYAISANEAIAVGDNECVLRTTDGVNWTGSVAQAPPSGRVSAPAASTVLTGTSTTISVIATDAGVGVAGVQVSVRRSDAKYWNGSAWQSNAAWLDANRSGTSSTWTLAWGLEALQDRGYTYSVGWKAWDGIENTATVADGSTNVRVDNLGPAVVNAFELDSTHVQVNFSEPLQPGSADMGAFSIPGLVVSGASVVGGTPTDVILTTNAHTPGATYPLSVDPGAVDDPYGNASRGGADTFDVPGVPAQPFLTVARGTDGGRPSVQRIVAQAATAVVDEIVLSAHDGAVSVSGISLIGTPTATFSADVAAVSAIADTDLSGTLNAGDTMLGSVEASGSMSLPFDSPSVVASGTSRPVWIVYKMADSAADARTVGSVVTSVAATQRVEPFGQFVSAASGSTLKLDAEAPSVNIVSPVTGAVVTPASATIAGTAADTVGLASVELSIRRSGDGQWWTGSGWSASETWVAVAPTADWTYAWTLDPGQNGELTHAITVKATDLASVSTTYGVTNVTVDNTRPTLTGATYVDFSHVDVTFSEPLSPASATTNQFGITEPTLTVTAVSLSGSTARLTVSGMAYGTPYTLKAMQGLTDVAGNALDTAGALFSVAAFTSGAAPPPPPPPPAPDPVPAPAPAPVVTPSITGHTLYTPVTPSTVYYGRSFTIYSFLKPRHKAGLYSLKYEGYRYERQSNGTYKWVRRATWYGKNYNYSTYTKCIKTGAVLKLRGKWRVRAVHTHTGYLPKYSGYRYFYVR